MNLSLLYWLEKLDTEKTFKETVLAAAVKLMILAKNRMNIFMMVVATASMLLAG